MNAEEEKRREKKGVTYQVEVFFSFFSLEFLNK